MLPEPVVSFVIFVYAGLLVVNTGLLIALLYVRVELRAFRRDLQDDTIERRKWHIATTCGMLEVKDVEQVEDSGELDQA